MPQLQSTSSHLSFRGAPGRRSFGQPYAGESSRSPSLFREVNERIAELSSSIEADVGLFICECTTSACTETFRLSVPEFEAIVAHGDRFVVVPGHERRDSERVVGTGDGFVVVEPIVAEAHGR